MLKEVKLGIRSHSFDKDFYLFFFTGVAQLLFAHPSQTLTALFSGWGCISICVRLCVCVLCAFFWAFLSWWSARILGGAGLITVRLSLRSVRCWLKGTLMLCRGRLTGSWFTFMCTLLITIWPAPLPRLWGPVCNCLSILLCLHVRPRNKDVSNQQRVCVATHESWRHTLALVHTWECWDQTKMFSKLRRDNTWPVHSVVTCSQGLNLKKALLLSTALINLLES